MAALLVAVAAASAAAPGAARAVPAAQRYLIELELAARQSGSSGRAELLAGARLLMRAERAPTGELSLRFERELEAPWKLFHVDPIGPFGRQTKVAAVVTLPEASWEALADRRAAHARFAAERWAGWRPAIRRKPPLDGAFAFVVIGPAAGRFVVVLDREGGVRRVDNRMTDRWLVGDFDRFVGTWGPAGETPGAPRGYWFWNGAAEPFGWEPGTYRALAVALELLDDLPRDAAAAIAAADRVVETLAPGARGRRASRSAPLPVERRESVGPGGETVIEDRARDGAAGYARRRVWRAAGGVVADRLELDLAARRSALRLAVGYRPAADEDETP